MISFSVLILGTMRKRYLSAGLSPDFDSNSIINLIECHISINTTLYMFEKFIGSQLEHIGNVDKTQIEDLKKTEDLY